MRFTALDGDGLRNMTQLAGSPPLASSGYVGVLWAELAAELALASWVQMGESRSPP